MRKQSGGIIKEKSSSRKVQDTPGESYVCVKYSELMALTRSASAASIALFQIAKCASDIKWMSLQPEVIEGLSQKLTDIAVIKHSTRSRNKAYEADESLARMAQILKSTGSHSRGSLSGPTKKSRKR